VFATVAHFILRPSSLYSVPPRHTPTLSIISRFCFIGDFNRSADMFRLEADGQTYWLNVGERQVVLTREENCRIIMGGK
jgi:hypothetical protein